MHPCRLVSSYFCITDCVPFDPDFIGLDADLPPLRAREKQRTSQIFAWLLYEGANKHGIRIIADPSIAPPFQHEPSSDRELA